MANYDAYRVNILCLLLWFAVGGGKCAIIQCTSLTIGRNVMLPVHDGMRFTKDICRMKFAEPSLCLFTHLIIKMRCGLPTVACDALVCQGVRGHYASEDDICLHFYNYSDRITKPIK